MKFTQLLSYSARLFLCLIVISLVGCENEIEEIDKHSLDSTPNLRSQVTSLYELESNTKLMNALSKITNNDVTTERNEVLQGIVVDSSYVKQIETEAFVFYTMFVYPNEPQDDLNKFKNLLAKEDKNGDDIEFYMIEYAPNSSLQYTAADGGSIIIPGDGEIYLDFIGSNLNETNSSILVDNCTFSISICINTKQGGIGPPHVKGPNCTDQSKISTYSWPMCNLGENPSDENPADYLDLSFTDGETSVGGSRRRVPPYIGVPEEDPDLATEPINLYVQNNFVNNLEPELKNWWDFTAADDQQKQEQKDAIEAFLLEHLDSSQPNGFTPEAEDFAEDVIVVFNENPELDWSFIENWFLGEDPGSDSSEIINPDDISYDVPLTQQDLPSMNDFVNNFPKEGSPGNYTEMPTPDVYELVGGSLWTSHQNDIYNNYQNACSIRGSRGLLYSGINIPILTYPGVGQRTQKGGDQNNYILDAVSFDKFMRDKFGAPTYELTPPDCNDPQKVMEFLKGKNGIYVIINSSHQQAGYSGHVDAIIDGKCISNAYVTPNGGVKSIAIWELE